MEFWSSAWGWTLKCAAWLLVFLAPVQATMIAVSALVVGDLVTGVWAALKRGETFSSAKFRQTVTKTIGYQLAIVLAFITESQLIPELPVVKVVGGLIASVEFTSAGENLSSILGIPIGDIIKKLFDKKQA